MPIYNTNFIQKDDGNSINSGTTLEVKIDGADHVSGGIYKDGLPIMADFGYKEDDGNAYLRFKLQKRAIVDGEWRSVGLALGTYTLKTRAWISNRGQGWDDEFKMT